MLRKLFKRKPPANAAEPELDIRSQRPSAGEIRTRGLNETLFLAPLPVYTGQPQLSRRNFSAMNDTYLELGGSNWGMVEQGKRLALLIWMMLFTVVIGPGLFILYGVLVNPENFQDPWHDVFLFLQLAPETLLLFSLPIGVYLYAVLSGVWTSAKTYPVRFNRQRREVCYVEPATQRVLIVPWEGVVAWVAKSQAVTSYGVMHSYTLGMGLEDEEQDSVQFLLLAQPSDDYALGMWASIRNYMEDGPLVETPSPIAIMFGMVPTEDQLKPYEGLHTFDIERKEARFMGALDDKGAHLTPKQREECGYSKRTFWPLRFWYLRRVLTFWKMPYKLAEWGHRVGRPALPEQVLAWSEPLPPEQWAQPSPALQKANAQVKTAMDDHGTTFVAACKAAGLH